MRHHQHRYGRNHDRDHMRRWSQSVSHGFDVYHPDDSRHHQGMDHDVAETDRKPREKLTKHRFLRVDRKQVQANHALADLCERRLQGAVVLMPS